VVSRELGEPAPDLQAVAAELVAVRYWRRFLDEVEAAHAG
jgi:hypothetical protein